MTNIEKIDFAVKTTLEAHPDYSEIMEDILFKKVIEEDPLVTAKYFSRANDARAHMIEVSNLDLLAEIIKNAVKVSFLFKQKGYKTSNKEQDIMGGKDSILFGSTACRWVHETLEKNPNTNIDNLLEQHSEILPILVAVFTDIRYNPECIIKVQELAKEDKEIKPILNKIEEDIHVFE